jgi:hypothetical protein
LSARAADEVPNIAILSLLGDKITTDVFVPGTGSKMEANRKLSLTVGNHVFDVQAIQAANATLKRLRPGVKTALLATNDPGLYEAQNALFEDVEGNKDNRIYLGSLLKNRAITELILITKFRSYAEFKVDNGRSRKPPSRAWALHGQ